jgi:urease accessory protein
MIMANRTAMTIAPEPSTPLALYAWLSPAFPVGAFAYSHGLEWAVEAGDVADAASLASWLADIVAHGALRSDMILLAAAWRAATAGDAAAAIEVNDLALALTPSAERHLETAAQGTAFAAAIRAAWPCRALDLLAKTDAIAYPVAVGVAAAGHAIGLRPTLEAFALAFCSNLVSAGVRLGCVGQSDAQRVIAGCCPSLPALAAFAEASTLEDLGSCAMRVDIASMRHETQYSRLFRS